MSILRDLGFRGCLTTISPRSVSNSWRFLGRSRLAALHRLRSGALPGSRSPFGLRGIATGAFAEGVLLDDPRVGLPRLARRPADRAAIIRRGVAELGDRYGLEVWTWWSNNASVWEVDFQRRDGGPTAREFKATIAEHRYVYEHRGSVAVAAEAGAALRWARAMRELGAAVPLRRRDHRPEPMAVLRRVM
jgi:hypothetical protein